MADTEQNRAVARLSPSTLHQLGFAKLMLHGTRSSQRKGSPSNKDGKAWLHQLSWAHTPQ